VCACVTLHVHTHACITCTHAYNILYALHFTHIAIDITISPFFKYCLPLHELCIFGAQTLAFTCQDCTCTTDCNYTVIFNFYREYTLDVYRMTSVVTEVCIQVCCNITDLLVKHHIPLIMIKWPHVITVNSS